MIGLAFCVIVGTLFMWLLRTWVLREARPRNDLNTLFDGAKDKNNASENGEEIHRHMYSERVSEMEAQKLPPKPLLEELDDYLLKNQEGFVSSRQTVRRASMEKARKAKMDKVRKVLFPKLEQVDERTNVEGETCELTSPNNPNSNEQDN